MISAKSVGRYVCKLRIFAILGILIAIFLSLYLSALFPNNVRIENDLWFGSDIKRVILNLTDSSFNHEGTSKHPLFPLLMLPLGWPISAFVQLIGFDHRLAQGISAQLITSFSGGVTWLFVYLISLNMGLSLITSFGLGLLFLSSSSYIFWWSTPETFPIGSLTILLPFLLLGLKVESRKAWLISLILSISITITNFVAGFIACYSRFSNKRIALKLCALSLAFTMLFSIVQRSYFSSARLLFQIDSSEKNYLQINSNPLNTLYDFFVVPMIAPPIPKLVSEEVAIGTNVSGKTWFQLDFGIPLSQGFSPFRFSVALIWIIFIANGVFKALFNRTNIVSVSLVAFLVFQFFLHSIYGDSPFLYSAHYTPVMIILGGYGLVSRRRLQRYLNPILLVLMSVFFLFLNLNSFQESINVALAHLSLI